MKQIHQQTGEILKCQYCDKDANAFIAGLYPVCKGHGNRFLSMQGTAWERMRQIRREEN